MNKIFFTAEIYGNFTKIWSAFVFLMLIGSLNVSGRYVIAEENLHPKILANRNIALSKLNEPGVFRLIKFAFCAFITTLFISANFLMIAALPPVIKAFRADIKLFLGRTT